MISMIQLLPNSLLAFVPINALLAQADEQSTSAAGAAGGAVGGLIGLVVGLLVIVSMWKVFSKAGQPGWADTQPFQGVVG